MSEMGSRLAIEIDEAGIDYNEVDLDTVVAYRQAYRDKTGQEIKLRQAIREIYGVK